MKSLLTKMYLHTLLRMPILFDANILMVGVNKYSFQNREEFYLTPILESFTNIYIHEEVLRELDQNCRNLIDAYIGKNVKIAREGNLYKGDNPLYVTIFKNISSCEPVNYERGESKHRGEVYSLAYAAYYGINYFCCNEGMVERLTNTLDSLRNIKVVTFDVIVVLAYCYYAAKNDKTKIKGLKSIYKKDCDYIIRRHRLPKILSEYLQKVKIP